MSVHTALFILMISYLVGLLGITFMFMRFKFKYQGLLHILIYYILSIIGVTLIYLRDTIDPIFSVIVSNNILFVGILVFCAGVLRLYKLRPRRWVMAVFALLYALSFWYFYFVAENVTSRILIYSLASAFAFLALIVRVMRSERSKGFKDLIVPVSLLMAINLIVRAVRTYLDPPSNKQFFEYFTDSLSLAMIGLLSIMLIAAVYAIVAEGSLIDLEEANENEKFYSSIYFTSPIPVIIARINGEVIHYNEALIRKLDLSKEDAIDASWFDYCSEEDAERIMAEVSVLKPGSKSTLYGINVKAQKGVFPAELILHRSMDKDDLYEAYVIDLSGNTDFLNQLSTINKTKEGILGTIPGFAYQCKNDDKWTMEILSESFYSITGYHPAELVDNATISFNDIILPEYQQTVKDDWEQAIMTGREYVGEYKIKKKNGEVIWVWEQGSPNRDEEGNITSLSGFISDITYRKEVEGALEYLSYHDSLTGLYNRRFMEEEMRRLDVKRNLPFTVVQLDIDGLKFANDAFGHLYGDKLIKQVAMILKETLRQDEIVGRMGGDEFLILLPRTPENKAQIVVDRVLSKCKQTKLKTRVSVSMGTATKILSEELLSEVLTLAEEKMYTNKMFKKLSMSEELVETLLEELYVKYPEELDVVNKTAKLIVKFSKHMNLQPKKVENLLKACRVHRLGLLSETQGKAVCHYRSEETYKMIRSIPDYQTISEIIVGYCEHYDGSGHPNHLTSDSIMIESQILALCSYIALNDLEKVSGDILRMGLKEVNGKWFDPVLVESFIEMVSK